jgi:hypothetical protein
MVKEIEIQQLEPGRFERLHGHGVDQTVRGIYEQTQKEAIAELQRQVVPGDVVVRQDPQTVGLVPELKRLGRLRAIVQAAGILDSRNGELPAPVFRSSSAAKAQPVLASRVGGIKDQITHGRSGLLLDDPSDLAPRRLPQELDLIQRLLG